MTVRLNFMKVKRQIQVLFVLLFLVLLSSCKKTDDDINSELLKGKWQYYEGFTDGEPLIIREPDDPFLTIHFYGNDSVNHFGSVGTYSVNEAEREIFLVFDDLTRLLEILKLDPDQLWTKQILNDNHVSEMHYNRIN